MRIFVIIGVFLLTVLIVFYSVFRLIKNYKDIAAPYYEQEAFQTPADVEKIGTSGASIKNIKIPIIMYHYVEYVNNINDIIRKKLDISPDSFEGVLKTLYTADYKTYFVKDIPDILDEKIVSSPKNIVLTFDDGYEDFYSVVFPLLKKYQMKATNYVIYDYIGRKGFLTENEIKELISSGLVEIGSHTLDHVYLKSLPEMAARKQIFDSKKLFEDRFNIKIKTFAYPYGAFNKYTLDLVKQAGYSAAVSVIPGAYQSKDNQFYLSRIRPGMFTAQTVIKVLEGYKN